MRWLICLIPLMLSFTTTAEQFEVFILAGQSNMDGRGAVKDLKGPLAKWAEPQHDVLINYSNSGTRGKLLATDDLKPLAPGYSVPPSKPPVTALPSQAFGPEVSFGRTVADGTPGKRVLLIKFCEGGTNLKSQWNADVHGKLYGQFIARVQGELKKLSDRGDTFTLRGILWLQGESDSKLSAEEYQSLLTKFIDKTRTDLKAEGVAFLIGEVYDNGQRDTVRQAERATAKAVKDVYFVPSDGLKTFDGGTHFDAASQIEFGRRFGQEALKHVK